MRSLIILPNTICEKIYEDIKEHNISKVVIVLEPFYLNENQHIQKLALMHACMDSLYLEIPTAILPEYKPSKREECFIYEPLDNEMYEKYNYCTMLKNPSILLSREEVFEMPSFTKQIDFYKHMRLKYKILVTPDKKPEGGRWSFDIFNRQRFPKKYEEPVIYSQLSRETLKEVKSLYPNARGTSKAIHYPTSFKGAKLLLRKFINTKLEDFGKYQDAFDSEIQVGEHANIAALMNIGMLTPEYVIKKVAKSGKNLESIEGFVRQVLGWREYMRYVYLRMPNIRKEPYLRQIGSGKVPAPWYDGTTGIPIFDNVISKVLETGYAHHIERLMVLNNAMIMYGFSHKEIYKWFMCMFADSYDWVMTGCVYMNHNSLASENRYMGRVYISSGNYIKKMSNYRGESLLVFDSLFRKFTNLHSDLLSRDYMLASYVKRQQKKKDAHGEA